MRKIFLTAFLAVVLLSAFAPTACAQATSPQVLVSSGAIQPRQPEQPLGRVMLRYNVGFNDGKFVIPPTGKELTLGERLGVIFLVAKNYGIPYPVLGAICAFQIYLPSHPEANKARLLSDFTYCAEMGARVLIASGGAKSPTDPYSWASNIKGYYGWGKPETDSYLAAVNGFVTNPPVVEGKKPW